MSTPIRSSRALGDQLRRERRTAGLTQHELATRTGLRQGTISRLESGEGVTLDTLFAVITALTLDLQLMERTTATPALDDLF